MLRISRVAGGQRNVTLHVTGVLTKGDLPLTPIDLGDQGLKLTSLVWLVQEKLGLCLWWDKETELLPMESRNSVRFDTSLKPPEGWDGKLWLSSFNFSFGPSVAKKVFFVVLDFDR
jgi:hypothetical protein